jgi:hypothetical protein
MGTPSFLPFSFLLQMVLPASEEEKEEEEEEEEETTRCENDVVLVLEMPIFNLVLEVSKL